MELQLGEKHPSNPAQSSPIQPNPQPPCLHKDLVPRVGISLLFEFLQPTDGLLPEKIIGNCRKLKKSQPGQRIHGFFDVGKLFGNLKIHG